MKFFTKIFLILGSAAPIIAPAQTADLLNPDVRQDTIDQTICVKGYTKSVRPAVTYTNGIKKKLIREQGLNMDTISDFELDHIIPLTLGGHPRNIHNLMLQPWEGVDGAKVKDRLEVKLARMVCDRKITLSDAQACIWKDWKACEMKYKHSRNYAQ